MIRIVALTNAGLKLGQKLGQMLEQKLTDDCELWFKPKPFTEKLQQAFMAGDRLILICATGIAVRTLAPVLESKNVDPPVLVLDEAGQFVIPLLSGHEGGANDWALQVSTLLSAQLVMTTAKPYLSPVYTVGMGCERHCPKQDLDELLQACLNKLDLSIDQISSINSIDIKADEQGLIDLANGYDKPFHTWHKEQLATVESQLSTKSDYVYSVVGVYGVAESAALFGAKQLTGSDAELILNKHKSAKATCAIARTYPLKDTPL
ncbi:MAG: cobalamin biosynthesis protein [Psychrosphaera sp.]|nr:cobalamin biosynthesis protein [Psychrosphaera sp.]